MYRTTLARARELELVGERGTEITRMLVDEPSVGAKKMAVMVGYLQPGDCSIIHAHPEEEAWVFLKGKFRATVGDVKLEGRPEECVFVPSNVQHCLENIGSGESMHICIHAPARPLPIKE